MHPFIFGRNQNRQDSFLNRRPDAAASPPYLSGLQANGPKGPHIPAGPSCKRAQYGFIDLDGRGQLNFKNGLENGMGAA